MRRLALTVEQAPADPTRWLVTVGDQEPRSATRLERRPWIAPVEVPAELVPLSADGWTTAIELADRLHRTGEAEPGHPLLLGRLLFEALLGPEAWAQVRPADAGDGLLELALSCPGAAMLHGLPWELMHDGAEHLALRDPPTTLTRVVAASPGAAAPEAAPGPPRLLFAIGSELTDDRIRSGTEFMALLRALETEGLRMRPRVLEGMSLGALTSAIKRDVPDIVHIVAHGRLAGADQPQLLLRPDDDALGATATADADQLAAALKAGERLPRLVVLSACESGTVGDPHGGALAAKLVAEGIPLVVAMSGRVSDVACRLFTRRFGSVLAGGCPLVEAVAQGRRAAYLDADPPAETADWALPALFASSAVKPGHAPFLPPADEDARDLVHDFGLREEPVFCGRRDFFAAQDELLDRRQTLQVLVIEGRRPEEPIAGDDANGSRLGVGRRRLLVEMAAEALRDGHVPILVQGGGSPPRTPRALASAVLLKLLQIRGWLELDVPARSALFEELTYGRGDAPLPDEPAARPQAILRAVGRQGSDATPLDPALLRQAIAADVIALLAELRSDPPPHPEFGPATRALVLLSAVEEWGDAADAVFTDLIDQHGLGTAREPVPVVISFAAEGGLRDIARQTRESKRGTWIRFKSLRPFQQADGEDLLATRWVLLNPRAEAHASGRFAYAARNPEGKWAKHFREYFHGLPAAFDDPGFYRLAQVMYDFEEFVRDDDRALLSRYAERSR